MAADAEMSKARAMDVIGVTNEVTTMDVVAAIEARATDVVAETTGMRDTGVGAQTDATLNDGARYDASGSDGRGRWAPA